MRIPTLFSAPYRRYVTSPTVTQCLVIP